MHSKTITALLGIIAGIVVGETTTYGSEIAVVSCVVAVVQLILCVWRQNLKKGRPMDAPSLSSAATPPPLTRYFVPLYSLLFFLSVTAGILRVQFSEEKETFICEKACSLTGTITTSPKVKNEYQTFTLRPYVENRTENSLYDVEVRVPLYPLYEVGEKMLLFGKVILPKMSMPHDGKKSFDYVMYLRTHSVGSEMFYPKVEQVLEKENTFVVRLKRIQEDFISTITTYVDEPASSLATGVLFGGSSMSQELIQTFRVAGLSHVVVLSGFNIAILISFVLALLIFAPLIIRVILAGVFVIFFVIAVGGEASIIRATLMSFIGLAALSFGRAYVARQALLLSLIGIILYEPIHLLHDVSLHLSFLATAGIVYTSDGVKVLFKTIQSKTYKEVIGSTLCAYLTTLPYVIYTFGTVSLYALLTNVLVVPLVPAIMLVTFLVGVSSFVSTTLAYMLGYVDTLLGNSIIGVARIVEQLPFSSLQVSLSFFGMCLLYLGLFFLYFWSIKRHASKQRNETSFTKNDGLISEILSF